MGQQRDRRAARHRGGGRDAGRGRRALHCDAVQAAGKVPLDVRALPVDFLSISGHKLFAPEGGGRALRAAAGATSMR